LTGLAMLFAKFTPPLVHGPESVKVVPPALVNPRPVIGARPAVSLRNRAKGLVV